jgi:hypothetical protein
MSSKGDPFTWTQFCMLAPRYSLLDSRLLFLKDLMLAHSYINPGGSPRPAVSLPISP